MQSSLTGAARASELIPSTLIQRAQLANINQDTQKKAAETDTLKTDLYYLAPFLDNRNEQAITRLSMLNTEQQFQLQNAITALRSATASADTAEIHAKTAELQRILTKYGIPQAKAEADYYTGAGRYAPYLGGAKSLMDLLPGKLQFNLGSSAKSNSYSRGSMPGITRFGGE